MANYTEYFYEYLKTHELPTDFDKFPKLSVEGLGDLDIKKLVIERNFMKEIGTETEELFEMYMTNKVHMCLIKYVPQIIKYNEAFDDVLKRYQLLDSFETHKITNDLHKTSSHNADGNIDNSGYYNPIDVAEESLYIQDKNNAKQKSTSSSSIDDTGTKKSTIESRRAQMFMSLKDNAELLDDFLKIKNVYLECVKEFDSLFMGVL